MNRAPALFVALALTAPAPAAARDDPPLLRPTHLANLSTVHDEDDPAPASDGLSLYYAGTIKTRSGGVDVVKTEALVSTRRTALQAWPKGKVVDGYFTVTAADNRPGSLTAEGRYPQYLFFASNKDPEKDEGRGDNFDIYLTVRQDRGTAFTAATPVNSVDSPADELHPWISADLRTLYFSRKTDEGWRVFAATRKTVKEGFGAPRAVELPVGFHHPTLTPDGKTIYLQGPLGEGKPQGLFRSTRTADGWSEPEPLTTLNHPEATKGDCSPALSRKGDLLYFASDRPGGKGGLDLWVIRTVELVKKPVDK